AEKEKSLLVAFAEERYRSAERSAEVAPSISGAHKVTLAVTGEWIARVQGLVHKVFVTGAVKLGRTRLHCDIEKTTAGLTKFRSIVARLDRDFLNSIRAGLVFLKREAYRVVRVIEPFKPISGRVRRRAVDDHS